MNILHLNAYYEGSAVYAELYSHLARCGVVDQHVLVPAYCGSKLMRPQSDDYRCYRSALFRAHHRLLFPMKVRRYERHCCQEHSELLSKADVLHAHTLFTDGCPAYRLSTTYHKPLIVTLQSTDLCIFYQKMPCWRRYAWRVLRGAKWIITSTITYRDKLLNLLPHDLAQVCRHKMEVIPYGVASIFHDGAVDLTKQCRVGTVRRPLNVLYAGTFIRRKNIGTLMLAADELRRKGKINRLRLIGMPEEGANHVVSMARARSAYVDLLPKLPAEELRKHYRWADVFVMASTNETFGLVYAEAMSQGTPVVCTAGDGFADWIEAGATGIAVKNHRDPREIAAAIMRLAAEGLPSACRKAATRFRWPVIAEEHCALYRKARTVGPGHVPRWHRHSCLQPGTVPTEKGGRG